MPEFRKKAFPGAHGPDDFSIDAAGSSSPSDQRLVGGWKEQKEILDKGSDKKFSIKKSTGKAVRELKDDMHEAVGVGAYLLAVLKFIGKMLYIVLRSIWRFLVGIAVIVLSCAVAGAVGIAYLYATSAAELPDLEDYTQIAMPQDSTIYDKDQNVIGIISTVERTPVSFAQISQPMKDAVVSIEDERFYNHEGVDLMGIARALKANYDSWRAGGSATSQGASTITQQYVRNAYANVGTEQTIDRKLTEMMLAAQLEAHMSKDDILNSYLNTVYFANGCYGVEAASQHYFGHGADTLDYYESAVLASILNSPSYYDPEDKEGREHIAYRANLVIDKMYSLGKLGDISQEELHALKQTNLDERLHITQKERVINQPYYFDYVRSELHEKYDDEVVESGGWQIYTTLSIEEGEAAADVVRSVEELYDNGITAAIADVDIESGAINAFCGGTDYNFSQFNIATSGHLQTGSTLKPILYAAACEYDGYYMSDQMDCTPVDIGTPDKPHVITPYLPGSSGTFKQGLVASDNAMAIHAAQTIGMDKVQRMCSAVGIEDPIEDNVVAVIGGQTNGLTPLEMASAYATIGNKGQARTLWCIQSITDNLGNEVYEHSDDSTYAMSSEVAAQVTDAMVAAVDSAGWYNIPYDKQGWTVAAKTGTTNDDIDSWCCGFNGTRAVSIWCGGRDQQMTVDNASSNTTHAFSDYFVAVGSDDPKVSYDPPQYKTLVPEFDKRKYSYESYTSLLKEKRFNINTEYVRASNIDDGEIVEVEGQGKLAARGSTVTIQVARDMVAVPDFSNMTVGQAYDAANGLDISFNITYSKSAQSEPHVTGQSIKQGEFVTKGTPIVLDVLMLDSSQAGTSTTIQQVPTEGSDSVMLMLQKERDSLKEQNDAMRASIEQYNRSYSADSAVLPNVVGLTLKDARQVLQSMGFSVAYSGYSTSPVTSMYPAAGSSVSISEGSVTLYTADSPSNSNSSTSNSNSARSSNANANNAPAAENQEEEPASNSSRSSNSNNYYQNAG